MFDIGWTELLVIAVVLIVVVGPKDLPPMLRAFGKMTQRARKVAGEFRAQFDEALREADLDEVRQTLTDAQKLNPVNTLREAMNPLRQMGNEIKADLQKATTVDNKTEVPPAAVSVPEPSMSLPETPPVVAPAPVAAGVENAAAQEKPKAARKPRAKAEPAPAAVAAPVGKPKRTSTKTAAAKKPAAVAATAAPKKTAAKKKKDDA
ncbi:MULTISPECIES: Sec-independent protein translocase protein TatB [unclassified Rhizobium]|jgi:sec-independent protein translocase protein TatB|uniref:Sec-independent protein translocase protein TatB n=1 Tax=unclassified Rhizobium TaxID=2613769 RepID=UPI00036C8DA1|nr:MULTISPECIES: Sec-independent protein translocase protein TatB [unclassified Rhizobium]MBD9445713.1 twin-arginine translocase subunit TatB [Rhizobium sp. RHZ01]MBD9454076.1 twin-arginine translocase subunit TatB [Rhizobium sp. RHZ02]